jgi:hypothetical protein
MLDENLVRKRFKRCASKLDELSERWDNRLTIDNLALAKRYINGNLRAVADVRVSRGGSYSKDFRAIFQRILPICGVDVDEEISGGRHVRKASANGQGRHRCANVDAYALLSGANGDDHSVLVQNVEIVDYPECLVVPSMVWLEPLDCLNSMLGRSVYVSKNLGFKFFSGREDRELRLSYVACAKRNDLASDEIERGTQVMDTVANRATETDGDDFSDLDVVNEVSRLRVVVGDDFVGVPAVEGGYLTLNVFDVAFGPFDL